MTPQEKAEELFEAYLNVGMGNGWAKQCVLIACNEVLGYMGADRGYEFWMTVKQEIEKL
jgi:hypothetical protein